GIDAATLRVPADTTQESLIHLIASLNNDRTVHGILVQMPLPAHIDAFAVVQAIDPRKDVDGLHPLNQGLMLLGQPCLHPCTPKGVLRLLEAYGIDPAGMLATVIGRSILVGRPLAALLIQAHATVTTCHSRTPDLSCATNLADLVIAATGQPGLVTAPMVKEGAVVVDVGINRVVGPDGKARLVGDVAYGEVAAKASWITPVPGGVGPMTIAMLMENTVAAYERAEGPAREAVGVAGEPERLFPVD
ncbi:MAG TPA: bifunctional 5,10-methylenetetrahydrofolate dehydrogenase/5,10-methenyltetrahydrofolate cyclohydrolase, partial [bacterium]|nr:bifunctional 5,10-methylenetetrahydrofolate dehydrogenase/5,10-methenyltetrahydrofolate cyclohydrolase [bacterium]